MGEGREVCFLEAWPELLEPRRAAPGAGRVKRAWPSLMSRAQVGEGWVRMRFPTLLLNLGRLGWFP